MRAVQRVEAADDIKLHRAVPAVIDAAANALDVHTGGAELVVQIDEEEGAVIGEPRPGIAADAATGWYGLVFPAGVPQPIVDKTQKALAQVLAQDTIKQQLANAGAIPALSTPAEFTKLISEEVVRWKKVATEARIQPQ